MRQRNKQGQFVKDQVNLTNDFKGLEIDQDKPRKLFPIVECVAALTFILGALVVLDHSGVIDLLKYLKP